MPFYRVGGLFMHVKFSGRARRNPPAQCVATIWLEGRQAKCCDISAYLCDWKLPDGQTCDAPLCQPHANLVGPNRHYCPKHQAEQLATQPQLALFSFIDPV